MTTEDIKWQTVRPDFGKAHILHFGEGETVLCKFRIIETQSGCSITKAPFMLLPKCYKSIEAAKQTCQDLYSGYMNKCEESALAHLGN